MTFLQQYNGKYFDQMEITDHPHMRADVIKVGEALLFEVNRRSEDGLGCSNFMCLTLGDSTISECMGKHLSASPHSAWLPPMNKS